MSIADRNEVAGFAVGDLFGDAINGGSDDWCVAGDIPMTYVIRIWNTESLK